MNEITMLVLAYLIGAIPFGVIAAKICGVNIFEVGSGSMGTTNVIRACGKKWGIAVLILDISKGAAATYLATLFFSNPWLIVSAGLFAMIGHSYSIFIKFRGGKSAATGTGILLITNPQIFLIVALVVIIVRQISGYQSLASLTGALLATILTLVYQMELAYIVIIFLGSAFVWVKHIANIKRLLNGTETKITGRNKQ